MDREYTPNNENLEIQELDLQIQTILSEPWDATVPDGTPTDQQVKRYRLLFRWLTQLFDQEMPEPWLTFDTKVNAHAYFSPDKWHRTEDGVSQPCIALNPKSMGREPYAVLGTLLHEMCHLYQHLYGKPGRRGYHNQEFADIMLRVGLVCSHTGEEGGKKTGPRMTHYVEECGPFARLLERFDITQYFTLLTAGSEARGPAKPKPRTALVQYACPCGLKAKAPLGSKLLCAEHQTPMRVVQPANVLKPRIEDPWDPPPAEPTREELGTITVTLTPLDI